MIVDIFLRSVVAGISALLLIVMIIGLLELCRHGQEQRWRFAGRFDWFLAFFLLGLLAGAGLAAASFWSNAKAVARPALERVHWGRVGLGVVIGSVFMASLVGLR